MKLLEIGIVSFFIGALILCIGGLIAGIDNPYVWYCKLGSLLAVIGFFLGFVGLIIDGLKN